MMLKNYLKIAFRNISRYKVYSFINISGLAVGLGIFILTALFVDFHFGFDRFHKDSQRIYTVIRATPAGNAAEQHWAWSPPSLSTLMIREFPEIEEVTRWIPISNRIIRYGAKTFIESEVWFADCNFFSFFSFEMISGNPETALAEPNSVVLTESTALKYFGEANPIGSVLLMDYKDLKLKVTGVTKDVPPDSSISYDFLVSAETLDVLNEWTSICSIFLRLKRGVDPAQMQAKFPSFIKTHVPNLEKRHERLYLFPLTDIHLKSMHIVSPYPKTTPIQLYLIIAFAVVLLLVVCINFMNLSTARGMNRAKEVGLRKVVGAQKHQLIKQFLSESVLLSLFALLIAIVLYDFISPAFLALVGSDMELSLGYNPLLLAGLLGVTVFVGIIAGSYPAFFLSSYKPASVLNKNPETGPKGSRARKVLVVTQFVLSVSLIVFTLMISRQFDLLLDVDLGYNRENVAVIPIHERARKNIESLRNELLKHSNIISVSASSRLPIDWGGGYKVQPEGVNKKDVWIMGAYPVGYDFIETLGMEIVKGRSFSRRYHDTNNYIISEMAARQMGWDEPLGKVLTVDGHKGMVIGVVRDFHFNHVFFKKKPSLLYLKPGWLSFLFIKLSSPPDAGVRSYIKEQWHTFTPNMPFEFFMLDHRFKEKFRGDTKALEIFNYACILSVFISCLGLFGLASHTVKRRTKEIGIRKAVGASVPNIVQMLIWDFVKLVAIANIIALPFAYYAVDWFLNWAWVYRIKVGVTIFVLAALFTLLSAFVSVILQTVKAAVANPVESLRYE